MQRRFAVAAVALTAIVIGSVVAALAWHILSSQVPEFFVGVEVAYPGATANDVKVMVDKIKGYTNLIVIGAPEISLNETALNETCDYISGAGMSFIVLFTERPMYSYDPFVWMTEAKQKYGDKFLGVYRFDEPGGNQLDRGASMLVFNATSYSDAADQYSAILGGIIINFYRNYAQVFTADYALQWFDYESNYSAVFSEFVYNNTREITVAECRGGVANFGADWGAMITWKYDAPPYVESGGELYADMVNAYKAGAKYVIVFDSPKVGTVTTLTEEHFDALRRFWSYVQSNPHEFASRKANVAYVLPQDYGFGLRRADDGIWGLFQADALSPKVWGEVNKLVGQYGFGLDIIYDEPGVVEAARNRYEQLFFWNTTVP